MAVDAGAAFEVGLAFESLESKSERFRNHDTSDDLDSIRGQVGGRRRVSRDPLQMMEVVLVVRSLSSHGERDRDGVVPTADAANPRW